ncbi:conserved Plasmodium protein, unknown function [Plasmodium knowlesi strain H]|uniref:Thioredoxin domain-containing protein n=3 Tax=Plasmodium knowlesi TaxID=5850 RepID=A0A5K1US66_PLAKH|nr:conserved Plasmodium protein, unknown function [Plasmodium knowlesi strain H]OTN66064.1 Uncharacterized protein PKNOH_S100041500 [Plasmodium knowlesi]CAA9987778.1 conserved Plasmodium protein, unknown function [Plasmodium knowlesi strain H]SBO27105.1 conserved Plasmodium protein, unknown function [Plasmodium knowlesi strain H]SBO29419.1 conserved Plasmodium protein, unknown function [Plasmodium knowlesi strain H]VVS77252.1 conserved Plasmodium protein, unknown function [Plasmodium knowlesi |eukprot:XP_002258775.1 hypothetical protein, conserved in Plasmodium species [Plasmodium knowlesi strain H]
MKLFFLLLFCALLKSAICEIKELSYHEFHRMLTTEKKDPKKTYAFDSKPKFKNVNYFQDFLYLKTDVDFVLYVYAKWDTDSNNLITVFREVERIIAENKIKIDFYTFNIDNAKELCNFMNIKTLPVILYVSSVHKKKYNSLLYKALSSSKDVRISNAFRYNGDMYCYEYIVEWIEAHHYFTRGVMLVKKLFQWKKK